MQMDHVSDQELKYRVQEDHLTGTDMVGQSVEARVHIDNASVGLTQAHPNNSKACFYNCALCMC